MSSRTKYSVGQKVIIDKIFVADGCAGKMKILEEAREALIVEVQPTPSLGPSYKIEWIDKSFPPPRIRYWEDDIVGLS